ncbi:hypothetical protein SAMN04489835_4676 [Mycolicibacterium rutilum]|uniref:Uncharacterized protein n=1 Tax=Mycolicibacterium rutilum TaxID=370526 RepID=A0A1H6L4L2_MYCRU|nr:DUF6636 domain-containing protein [Mycolicibacterium rutilum]SEH83341.1 hypothetical protein SAMN04489835_4676 [Mycolicibacterium rutilum]
MMASWGGRGATLVVCAAGALTLPACGSQPSTAAPSTSPVPTATERSVDGPTGFIAPSGNIACRLDATYARCDIMDRDWSSPPKPADCEWDYGQGLLLVTAGPAEFICAGDTAFGVEDVLPYGEAVRVGPMRCESAEAGVTCRNADTGRGFVLSRQSYQLI